MAGRTGCGAPSVLPFPVRQHHADMVCKRNFSHRLIKGLDSFVEIYGRLFRQICYGTIAEQADRIMIHWQTLACSRFISVFGGFAEVSEEWATRGYKTQPCIDLKVEVHQTCTFIVGKVRRPCVLIPAYRNDTLDGYWDCDALVYLWSLRMLLGFDLVIPMHGFRIVFSVPFPLAGGLFLTN